MDARGFGRDGNADDAGLLNVGLVVLLPRACRGVGRTTIMWEYLFVPSALWAWRWNNVVSDTWNIVHQIRGARSDQHSRWCSFMLHRSRELTPNSRIVAANRTAAAIHDSIYTLLSPD